VALPSALSSRVLRKAVLNAGARPTELALGHVDAVDALLSDWHGQTRVDLPGRLTARRAGDALIVEQTSVAG
jgi:tRNA(Ile)-lysidine synthase